MPVKGSESLLKEKREAKCAQKGARKTNKLTAGMSNQQSSIQQKPLQKAKTMTPIYGKETTERSFRKLVGKPYQPKFSDDGSSQVAQETLAKTGSGRHLQQKPGKSGAFFGGNSVLEQRDGPCLGINLNPDSQEVCYISQSS